MSLSSVEALSHNDADKNIKYKKKKMHMFNMNTCSVDFYVLHFKSYISVAINK